MGPEGEAFLTIVLTILIAILFALSAFFSGAETILFSLSPSARSRIRERSVAGAQALEKCLADSSVCLSTILVGNTLVNFAIATLGYMLFVRMLPDFGGLVSVPVMTLLLLAFGEITPKQIALGHAEAFAPAYARALLVLIALLSPLNRLFRFAAQAFGPALERERRALSDAELVSVLEYAAERGDFAQADAEMIEGVLRLSELHANDEMTPRVDMEGLDCDYPDAVRRAMIAKAKHRHLPVYRRSPDLIEGVFDRETGRIEEALFVPEQVTLDDLLVTFRKSGKPLAIVLDEYGGTAGIITANDVLELIVGPSVFGENGNEPKIVKSDSNTWLIDARASLDEINRELGVELEAEDADRLSGWVAFHTERIPHVGQQIEADGCRATILKRRRRRVTRVKLEVLEYPKTDTDEELMAETDEAVEKTAEDNR